MGEPIGQIDVPERPTGLRFGGPGNRTLYILTHHSLYTVRLRDPGVRPAYLGMPPALDAAIGR